MSWACYALYGLQLNVDQSDYFWNANKNGGEMDESRAGFGAKIIAIILIMGGLCGIVIVLLMLIVCIFSHHNYFILLVLYVWVFIGSGITGVRLWRNDPRGWAWAMIIFAAQIPVLRVPGFSYEFYLGATIKLMGGNVEQTFPVAFGSALELLFFSIWGTNLVYGVNLFAVAILVYLLLKRPELAVAVLGSLFPRRPIFPVALLGTLFPWRKKKANQQDTPRERPDIDSPLS